MVLVIDDRTQVVERHRYYGNGYYENEQNTNNENLTRDHPGYKHNRNKIFVHVLQHQHYLLH
jgi:hypothetical protein